MSSCATMSRLLEDSKVWRQELQELTAQVLSTKQCEVLLALQSALTRTQDATTHARCNKASKKKKQASKIQPSTQEATCDELAEHVEAYSKFYASSDDAWRDDIAATCLASFMDYTNLGHASLNRRDCRKTLDFAIRHDWRALQFASDRLRSDFNVLKLCSSGLALGFACPSLRGTAEAAMWAVTKDALAYVSVMAPAVNNEDVIWAAAKSDASIVRFVRGVFPRNLAFYAVSQDGMLASMAKYNGFSCKVFFGDHWLPDNYTQVLRAAIKQNPEAIRYARNFGVGKYVSRFVPKCQALCVVESNGLLLEFLGDYQGDEEVVRRALENNGLALRHACARLQRVKSLVLVAVRQNGTALCYADPVLNDDYDVVHASVAQDGIALAWAHSNLKNDATIVRASVAQNGLALSWASPTLQNDEALVRFAMANNIMAFQCASLALRNKDDLARQACKANPRALQFAETLQHDDIVVMECVLQDGACLAFASSGIRSRHEYISCALKTCDTALAFATWCGKLNYLVHSMFD